MYTRQTCDDLGKFPALEKSILLPVKLLTSADIRDYSIERISTSGDVPPRFYEHRATLCDGGVIEIRTASENSGICSPGIGEEKSTVLRLNTETRIWTR